jgi:hypothetical protein
MEAASPDQGRWVGVKLMLLEKKGSFVPTILGPVGLGFTAREDYNFDMEL